MTGLVDGLEEAGYVTREPHPGDRRATLVTLTGDGTSVMSRMKQDQEEFASLLFADLGDRELAGLNRGLAHVLAKLREHVPEGGPDE